MILFNIRYACRNLEGVIFPCGRSEATSYPTADIGLILMFSGNMNGVDVDKVNAILEGAHSLCIFRSVAFIRCNGGGCKL